MTSKSKQFPKPKIIETTCEYDGFFKINRAVLQQPRLDGSKFREVSRYVFERGDAAAILLHDFQHQSLLFVRQFRYPPVVRNDSGWLLEIIAGSFEEGDDVIEIAQKEILEEAGLTLPKPRYMSMFYLSPGGSSERCFLFETPVDTQGLHGRIGGETGTDEDVRVEIYTIEETVDMIRSGEIVDAKTIIAVQKLLLGHIQEWRKYLS